MKQQTLEEAAKEFARSVINSFRNSGVPSSISDIKEMISLGFKNGAEWQANQSPWISVEQAFPPLGVNVIHTNINTGYFYCGQVNNVSTVALGWTPLGEVIVTHYMMIPPLTFDEILEANKDVLERIKEKEVRHG
ncbi:MAG: hypothetical protein KHY35_08370 [Bacteroides thetaiotaomicron]|uniref:DUF551 domain-containing protein n=1 Tax=Bacteroides thetaiotaomicron TaxID=818 RepID=A0A943DMZ4_BACT4|nr:hypothetical protein [Bacteroides thetaiotaomicron]